MADIASLVQTLERSHHDVFWQGGASAEAINELEALLGALLPASFRDFLVSYGGGGVVEEEISGIEDDAPVLENRGTVYGDTLRCRADYGLPAGLAVIYCDDNDAVWCLATDEMANGECPVVSFDVFSKTNSPIAGDFRSFFLEYLTLRIPKTK